MGTTTITASWESNEVYSGGSVSYTLKVINSALTGYELATSVTDLDGATAIIYCTNKTVAMGGKNGTSNNFKDASAQLIDGKLYPGDEVSLIKIEKLDGGYTLKIGDQYLNSSSTGSLTLSNDPQLVDITFNSSNVRINFASNNILTHPTSPTATYFNTASSVGTNVQLYIKKGVARKDLNPTFPGPYTVDLGQTLTVSPTLPAGVTLPDNSITYESNDPSTATVESLPNNDALISTVSDGQVTITATFAGSDEYKPTTATFEVDVESHLIDANATFSQAQVEADLAGEKQISVQPITALPEGLTVTYSSSNPAVAEINATTGEITLKKKGETTITASWAQNYVYAKGSATYKLIVKNSDEKPFVKVTDVKQLYDGAKAIIVNEQYKMAMGSQNSGNYRNLANIEINDGKIIPDEENVAIVEIKEYEGGYSLYVTNLDEGYLYRPTDKNTLSVTNSPKKATITIAENSNATIKLEDNYFISYNKSNPRFSFYANVQEPVQLYIIPDSRPALELSFEQESYSVEEESTVTVKPIATSNGGTVTIANADLRFSSDNEVVATVSNAGVVTGLEYGSAKITVKYVGNDYQAAEASYIINVTNNRKDAGYTFGVDAFVASLAAENNEFPTLTTTETGAPAVTYNSSAEAVATIDASTGVITLVGPGTTVITAKWAGNDEYNGGEVSYTLTVKKTAPTAPDGGYKIAFKIGTSTSTSLSKTTPFNTYVTTGAEYLEGIESLSNIYHSTLGGLRFSTSSVKGNVSFNLANEIKIEKIYVKAQPWNASEDCSLGVNGSDAQSIDEEGYYLYSFTPAEGEELSYSSTLKFEATKRLYVSEIIIFGDMKHTKCANPEISTGSKKTFFPGEIIEITCSTPDSKLTGTFGDKTINTEVGQPYTYTFTDEDADKKFVLTVKATNADELIDESETVTASMWVRPAGAHHVEFKIGTSENGTSVNENTTPATIAAQGAEHLTEVKDYSYAAYNSKGGLRLSTADNAGTLTLGLAHYLTINKVIVHATPYNAANGGKLAIDGLGTRTTSEEGDLVFVPAEPTVLRELKLVGTAGQRIYIADMSIYGVESEDPTICKTPKLSTDQTTFRPGETIEVTTDTEGATLTGTIAGTAFTTEPGEPFTYTFKNSDVNKKITLSVKATKDEMSESTALTKTFTVEVSTEAPAETEDSQTILFKKHETNANGTAFTATTHNSDFISSGTEFVKSNSSAGAAYYLSTGGLKLGSNSNNGTLTLKLSNKLAIDKIVVKAKQYSTSAAGSLTVNGSEAYTVTTDGYYVYDFIPDTQNGVDVLTITGARDKTVCVAGITIYGSVVSHNKCEKPEITPEATTFYIGDSFTVKATGDDETLKGTFGDETIENVTEYTHICSEADAGKTVKLSVVSVSTGLNDSEALEVDITVKTEPSGVGAWEIVTSSNDIEAGGRYIIACGDKAISTQNNANNRRSTDVRLFGTGKARMLGEPSESVMTFIVEDAGDGKFKWKAENYLNADNTKATDAYLYYKGRENNLYCGDPVDNYTSTSVEIDGSQKATITFDNTDKTSRVIRYNTTNGGLFNAYTSSTGELVEIYRQIEEAKDYTFPAASATMELTVGETKAIEVGGRHPEFKEYAGNPESVVTVSADGVVTAVAAGKAEISLSWDADKYFNAGSAKIAVIVSKKTYAPTLPDEISIYEGGTYQIELGEEHPAITFGSNDNVTVSADGLVTGVKSGDATITMAWGDDVYAEGSAAIPVNVTTAPKDPNLSFRHEEVRGKLGVGVAWLAVYNDSPVQVTYSSSNTAVVEVNDKTGEIRPVDIKGVGEAVITAKIDDNHSASYTVKIEEPAKPVAGGTTKTATFDFTNSNDAYGLYPYTSENGGNFFEGEYGNYGFKQFHEFNRRDGQTPVTTIVEGDNNEVTLILDGVYRIFKDTKSTSLRLYYNDNDPYLQNSPRNKYNTDLTYNNTTGFNITVPEEYAITSVEISGDESSNQGFHLIEMMAPDDDNNSWNVNGTKYEFTNPLSEVEFWMDKGEAQLPILKVNYAPLGDLMVAPQLTFKEKVYNFHADEVISITPATSAKVENLTVSYSIDNLTKDDYMISVNEDGTVELFVEIPGVYTLRAVSEATANAVAGMAIARLNVYPKVEFNADNVVETGTAADNSYNYSIINADGDYLDFDEHPTSVKLHYTLDDGETIVHDGSTLRIDEDQTVTYWLNYGGVYESPKITHHVVTRPAMPWMEVTPIDTPAPTTYTFIAPEGTALYYKVITPNKDNAPMRAVDLSGWTEAKDHNDNGNSIYTFNRDETMTGDTQVSTKAVKYSEKLTDNIEGDPNHVMIHVDGTTTGIDTITADDNDDVRYYDMTGRPVRNPAPGIAIRVKNGVTEKVVIK